jgi:hypothetical protein
MAFFYFSFSDVQKQNLGGLLTSLIIQFCQGRRPLPHGLQSLYEKSQPGAPSIDALGTTLKSIVEESGEVYLILDALDECPEEGRQPGEEERREILAWLKEIHAFSLPNLHILVTSRKETDIEYTLSTELASTLVCIEDAKNKEDIRLYVTNQINDDRRLKTLRDDVKEEVKNTLMKKAGGM